MSRSPHAPSFRLRVAIAAATLLVGARAAEAAKPRIAVVAVTVEKAPPGTREKLEAAVAGGLAASGADVIDAQETSRRMAERGIAGCATPTCLATVAQDAGARYLVRGAVEIEGRSYGVHLELLDGATGAALGSRDERCEICTEGEAYETASLAASALKADLLKRRAPADGGAKPDAPGARGAGAAPALAVTPRGDAGTPATVALAAHPADTRADAATGRARTVSFVAIGAGAVAIGAGVALLAIDGDGTCSHTSGMLCERRYRTQAGGITALGIGVLAAAVGAVLLIKHF